MEPRPRNLVGAESERSLQAERANAALLVRDYQAAANQSVSGMRVPAKIVPAGELRRSQTAQRTSPSPIPPRPASTSGTDEALRPAQTLQVGEASSIVSEPGEQLTPALRGAGNKAAVAIAVEKRGRGMGRIRLARNTDTSADSLLPFIEEAIEAGSVVYTDGHKGYKPLSRAGYLHEPTSIWTTGDPAHVAMPRVRRVSSLLKRWLT